MHRAFTVCLILCMLGIAGSLLAEDKPDPAKPKKSTTGAVFRSLAFPGWGQWYNESRYKAVAFFAIETFFLVGILQNNSSMMAAKRADELPSYRYRYEIRDTGIPWHTGIEVPTQFVVHNTFHDERLFRSSRNKNVWWFVAIKLLSLGDAYVDAQLFKIDISPSLVPEDPSGMQISATVRF